ncbi:MAG: NAD(+)/NADH kinase [Bacteroidales bacterium]|nr:NAD(+)/NADH kinase [Bacteroidales bacterium]
MRKEITASLCSCSQGRIDIVDDVHSADILLSLGGDGTLLNTLPVVGDSEVPVLGLNLGRLGFLTGVGKDDIPRLASLLIEGAFDYEKRQVLEISCSSFEQPLFALNEAAILRDENTSTVSVEVFVDNLLLNIYSGDGVIFATPTGSTAYSMSCGGPILTPQADNIVITPVASHTLTVRPIVLRGDSVINAVCPSVCKLTLDSRNYSIDAAANICIRRAGFSFVTMKPKGKEFFETLRDKLFWGK